MYLIFDTETTGLPANYKAPATDLENWPRVIQLGWQLYNKKGKLINEYCELIKPDGWEIPATEIKKGEVVDSFQKEHGFTTENNIKNGVPMIEALDALIIDMDKSKLLIAHNMNFDKKIIGAEFIRYDKKPQKKIKKICTMEESIELCKLKTRWGAYKWPTLMELHTKLFKEGFEGAHDALDDVRAAARCFFELKKRGIILKS